MADVLVRNVSDEVMAIIRSTAAEQGETLQGRLSRILEEWAMYQRRQTALRQTAARLAGQPDQPLSDEEHEALLDEMKATIDLRWQPDPGTR
ncbi:hypothetical protein TEK04_17980 [Klenkia sp. LSe6-5]|uniref:Uncharacterized protein n=1 Tax=Klenkia sesuvii TaxID=3103137 RepID=A0ABU8DYN3_9ACTN